MNEIKRFNKDVIENKDMMAAVKKFGNDVGKIVAFANDKGYTFTIADVEVQSEKETVLSEEQLDGVSGGGFVAGGNVQLII